MDDSSWGPRPALLLSIRPPFVASILAGEKTVELRRQKPRVQPKDRLFIYSSSPAMALVAVAEILEVVHGTPRQIWLAYSDAVGISRDVYDAYFADTDAATALVMGSVQELENSIPLARLRSIWPGFHPPQSFRYIQPTDWSAIGISSFEVPVRNWAGSLVQSEYSADASSTQMPHGRTSTQS